MKRRTAVREVLEVDPQRCRVWALHPRSLADLNEATCKAEISSMTAHGQVVPVLGRRVQNDPSCDIELIYGARRLFAARYLKKALRVEVRELSDRDALVALEIENHQRRDLSVYERGLAYRHWLRSGIFATQSDLSRALNVSSAQISRCLRVAQLPAVVLAAFEGPHVIREDWGMALMDGLEDPQRRAATLRVARSLSAQSMRLPAREVIRKLLAAGVRDVKAEFHRDRIVTAASGAPLFRVRHLHRAVSLIFPATEISDKTLERIEIHLVRLLQQDSVSAKSRERKVTSLHSFCEPSLGSERQISAMQSRIAPPTHEPVI